MDLFQLKWKEFYLTNFFIFEKGKDSSPTEYEIKLGKGINCAIAKNNNSGFVGKKINPTKIYHGDKLLIVAQGDGGAGLAFFADGDFCANKCVWVGTPKFSEFNKYVGLFLATIISKLKTKFNHSKGINEKMLNLIKISLPVNDNEEPDWKFMEKYISDIYIYIYELFERIERI